MSEDPGEDPNELDLNELEEDLELRDEREEEEDSEDEW